MPDFFRLSTIGKVGNPWGHWLRSPYTLIISGLDGVESANDRRDQALRIDRFTDMAREARFFILTHFALKDIGGQRNNGKTADRPIQPADRTRS